MADSRHGRVQWYLADPRAILPLDAVKVSRTLRQRMTRQCYQITFDQAFEQVIRACAAPTPARPSTWINDQIIDTYNRLHHLGLGHSVEAWDNNGQLVGGLYGLSLHAAFFGESMFSTATDASKVCLVALVHHLNQRGYTLLDAQIGNDHMKQFGQIEIPLDDYLTRLHDALAREVSWCD